MIQPQGTGTPPDTDTAEQPPEHRYGEFTYPVPASGGRRRKPETETEVAS